MTYYIAPKRGDIHKWVSGCCDREPLCRPVVVIDPEDREVAKRLARVQYDLIHKPGAFDGLSTMSQDVYTEFMQDALRSLIAPPKPEEPERYGVVVAGDGREWFRWTTSERRGRDWCRPSTGDDETTQYATWDDLDVIRVVWQGVQA